MSSGDDAAKDLLGEISALSNAPLLAGSVVDDDKRQMVLSNGSTVRSIPASEKQARGKSIDLLIIDEACYVDEDIWRAARYTILARPGARVVLSSTPRGRRDRFFAKHFYMAKDGPASIEGITVESFHWPSLVSPLVDKNLVEFWRKTDPPRIFEQEVLAEWPDEAGAWFSSDELDANVASYTLLTPGVPGPAKGQLAVAGVDWGATNDACTVVTLSVLGGDYDETADEPTFFVSFFEEQFRYGLNAWAARVAELSSPAVGGFDMHAIASEANGIGTGPTETLRTKLWDEHGIPSWKAKPVFTDNRGKQSRYGVIKMLLQQNRLILPAERAMRRQLEALEYSTTDAGNTQIYVPESSGHDDIADALMQAAGCVRHVRAGRPAPSSPGFGDKLTTPAGVDVMERPRCAWHRFGFQFVRGADETGDGW